MIAPLLMAAACILADDGNRDHNQKAIAFLRTLQTPSGGFVSVLPSTGEEPTPSLRTTRTAVKVFQMLEGQPTRPEAVVKYLMACHDPKSGGFSDRPGIAPDAISTSVALMIMGQLKLPQAPYVEPGLKFMNDHTEGFEQIRMVAPGLEELDRQVPQVDAWLKVIDEARNPDGSYGWGPGKARSTALYVVAQMRLGGKPESTDFILKVLQEGQREDGGFGGDLPGTSDLEACYRIVRLFARLDAQPNDPEKLRAFIASCYNDDGGYGRRTDEPSSLHGTYYATIVRYWLSGGK